MTVLRRFLAWPSELRQNGVIGINQRNLDLLLALNPRRLYPQVDDKVITKQLCRDHGIPVPDLYAVISRFGDLRRLDAIVGSRNEFVLKPACGAGGRGVTVIRGRSTEGFLVGRETVLSLADLKYHLSTTLSGLYSLGGQPDRVIIEQRIVPHPVFRDIAVEGTPDIRIIVYRGTPVMTMLRLPTKESRGRANLHQGAVAAGVDLERGITTGGVWRNRAVDRHPDTGAVLAGVAIPFWRQALEISCVLGRATGLGFVGVDVVLDVQRGPVVLEANARPGLSVQIANRRGLARVLASAGGWPPGAT